MFATPERRRKKLELQRIIKFIEQNERTNLYHTARQMLYEQKFINRLFGDDEKFRVVDLDGVNLVASEVLYEFGSFTIASEEGYPVISGNLELTDTSVIAKTRCATEEEKKTYAGNDIVEDNMIFYAGYIFWNAGDLQVQFSARVEDCDRIEVKFSTAINEGGKTDGIH
jgi:hypothetical protein